MKTAFPLTEIGEHPTPCAEVGDFLDAVRKEQVRYLDSIRQVASSLRTDAGQLALVAANQNRLTQQFFDAQRSILVRRAQFDAEVELIDRVAEEEAETVVRSARRSTVDTALIDGEQDPVEAVIDAAFRQLEPDVRLAQQGLAALLDEWWFAENRDGRAMIDEAHARAAMRRRLASIEAGEIIEANRRAEPVADAATEPERLIVLPEQVLAVLDAEEPTDLDSLLSALAESLDPPTPPASTGSPPRGDDLVIVMDREVAMVPHDAGIAVAPEHTGRLLSRLRRRAASSESFGWIPVRAVLPMTAVTSGLAVFMAWLG